MLTHRSWPLVGALVPLLVAITVPAAAAGANGGVTCPDLVPDCDINVGGGGEGGDDGHVDGGGTGGGGGSNGGGSACYIHWTNDGDEIGEVPCHTDMGWFNFTDECYWSALDPQPKEDAEDWEWGSAAPPDPAERAEGTVYNRSCPGIGRELYGGSMWSLTPPPGYGGGPSPEELAQQAVEKMRLLGAQIGTAPDTGNTGIVGMPVWLWTVQTARTWGPVSASASAAGVTVTATATAKKIVYTMGDGGSVTCTGAGTPYEASYGGSSSPDCGYRYAKTSSGLSGDAFTVGAVTTWTVRWQGGGQEGELTTTRAAEEVQLAIGEAQVVAKP